MRIALAQLNFKIGDIAGNISKIKEGISQAIENNAQLIIFSELSIIGYPPEDLLFSDTYEYYQEGFLEELLPLSIDCDIIVGGIEANLNSQGKKYFNTAIFISKGQVKSRVRKALLPSYDVFNETRFFEPGTEFSCIESHQKKIALTICEDIWDEVNPQLYSVSPLDKLAKQEPDLIINIAASPYEFNKSVQREKILTHKCQKHRIPAIYVNQVGAQTELLFDGNSTVMSAEGQIILKLPSFKEKIDFVDFAEGKLTPVKKSKVISEPLAELKLALEIGIKDYFSKNGFKKAVLGSSGGIDSAIVQTLASNALGAENVTAVLMPSKFSSKSSIEDAEKLSLNLRNPFHIVPIGSIYNENMKILTEMYGKTEFDVTEENLQSRIRAVILMAFSNKHGNLLLNTSNKSELAVGYGTLYGDMCGALSVIGDLYKSQVFALARYINLEKEIIPYNIIEKAPSAELRPNQKDSDSLPDYEVLDNILRRYIEDGFSVEQLIAEGYDEDICRKILKLVAINEHKRYQAPPVLKVSKKAFGRGRIIPLTAKYL